MFLKLKGQIVIQRIKDSLKQSLDNSCIDAEDLKQKYSFLLAREVKPEIPSFNNITPQEEVKANELDSNILKSNDMETVEKFLGRKM